MYKFGQNPLSFVNEKKSAQVWFLAFKMMTLKIRSQSSKS